MNKQGDYRTHVLFLSRVIFRNENVGIYTKIPCIYEKARDLFVYYLDLSSLKGCHPRNSSIFLQKDQARLT